MVTHIKRNLFICSCLIAITIAVYWRVPEFGFVHYDDDIYVTANDQVRSGLTADSIRYAFTLTKDGNWIPLTWMSLMADHEVSARSPLVLYQGRDDPFYYHRTNLVLHAANTVMLFLFLSVATGTRWRSAMVAALFAVHPLHVESVAWAAERKDVLSTFFMMLTLLAYIRYAGKPGTRRYVLVALLFALGLLSKSMLMTLPLVLLLLDFWPLKRVAGSTGDKKISGRSWRQLIVEKVPLLAMSAAVGIVTVVAQEQGGTLRSLVGYPLGERFANALTSYLTYLWKMIWPVRLACLYPHPHGNLPVWQVIGSGLMLAALTFAAVRAARKLPYLTVGWLWYVITLLPVIGIVQVGLQSMADRYTYITLTGVFTAVVWGTCELIPRGKARIPLLAILAAAVIVPLSLRAYSQTSVWRDSKALFTHAIDVTTNNGEANHYLANALYADGELDASIRYYREAERLKRTDPSIHNNLGVAYSAQGNFAQSREEFLAALRIDRNCTEAMCNLAALAANQGNTSEALRYVQEANRIAPNNERVRRTMRAVEAKMGITTPIR